MGFSLVKYCNYLRLPFSGRLFYISGCSVARLSRMVWDHEVAGSNPATPTEKMLNHGGFTRVASHSSFIIQHFYFLIP